MLLFWNAPNDAPNFLWLHVGQFTILKKGEMKKGAGISKVRCGIFLALLVGRPEKHGIL